MASDQALPLALAGRRVLLGVTGGIASPEEVVAAAVAALAPRDLPGARVVVTAGPTHEPIDPVRFLGNRSSGRMGVAIAAEAISRGATVSLVFGPGTVAPP